MYRFIDGYTGVCFCEYDTDEFVEVIEYIKYLKQEKPKSMWKLVEVKTLTTSED